MHISFGAGNWDSIENEAQFIQIMQAFGQSFMQPDITIFKHNLEAMESLNSKYKLYHKVRNPIALDALRSVSNNLDMLILSSGTFTFQKDEICKDLWPDCRSYGRYI